MIKKGFSIIFSLILLLSTFSATSVFAVEESNDDNDLPIFQELTKEQEKFVKKINKGLEKIGNDPKKVKEYLLENDFEQAEIDTGFQTMNHASVNLRLEYFRNTKNGLYTFVGYWEFTAGRIDTSDSSEEVLSLSLWNTNYSVPSGIVFASYPTRLYVYDSLGALRENTSTHFDGKSNGFIWKYQDVYTYNGSGYKGQNGTAIFWATSVPSSTLYGVMNYMHTYNKIGTLQSATITGGTDGVNLSATFSGGSTGKQNFRNQVTISSWPGRYVE